MYFLYILKLEFFQNSKQMGNEVHMFFKMEHGKITEQDIRNVQVSGKTQYFGYFSYDEREAAIKAFGLDRKLLSDMIANKPMAYENHEDFDVAGINILNRKALFSQPERVCIFIYKNMLLFFCKNLPVIEKIIQDMMKDNSNLGFNRILSTFFEKLTTNDYTLLGKIEQDISDLENALITRRKKNCVKEIISLRKRLMIMKQYYEQLLNVLDELQEDENELLFDNSMQSFYIYASKVERLYHNVMNLRDYVTQVRESYQAEIDIDLNNIMKIFTVITAIFLPLTLLVGWYGMNLKMPEFQWPLAYPMVIVISIAVVGFCILYFKRKKWF